MARQSVSKHLAVLEAANLVATTWRGREKLHYLNAEPINAIADRWINQYDRPRVQTLADLKTALESKDREAQHMTETAEFVYTTYIRTTPERLWQAITDPAFSRNYMGHAIESDWKKGSTYAWLEGGLRIEHPDQVILESDPYRRLAFTFHTFVPEIRTFAPALTDEVIARLAAERRSRVAFDLEPDGDHVKLTVVHDDFELDSTVLGMVSQGWPRKLADLKSGLESSAASAD
jgi:uncharacterized protein YndB with AHSA1/START domain